MVKATFAVKRFKTIAKGTYRQPQGPIRDEIPVPLTIVLRLTPVLGPVRPASSSSPEQAPGSSSQPSGPANVSTPLLPPADLIVVSSGDISPGRGGGSSRSGVVYSAMV